jgi:hypothetical protein
MHNRVILLLCGRIQAGSIELIVDSRQRALDGITDMTCTMYVHHVGRFFAASQAKLQQIAEHFNLRYVVNLARCPAR